MGYPLTYTESGHNALNAHSIPAQAAGLGITIIPDSQEAL